MLVIPIVAWGKHHIETARFCLASLMSEGNLPDVEAHVKIYTDEPKAFPGYETVTIKPDIEKHKVTTNCFINALSEGYPIVTIAADMVASEGTLAALEKHADKIVMVPVLRIESSKAMQRFEQMMEKNVPFGPKGRLRLPARELCGIAFDNLHPRLLLQFFENMPSATHPTTIYRRHGNTIAARCFHMHPLLLRPGDVQYVTVTIDGEMMSKFPEKDFYVVVDSDEMMVCDISDINYNWNGLVPLPVIDALNFANRKTISRHRWFFEHESYLHSGELEQLPADPRMDKFLADVAALQPR